jgi:transcriptional regulator with XRE-family HTH domain
VHVSTISNIERGRLNPWPGQRAKLARALDWPEDREDELFEAVSDERA